MWAKNIPAYCKRQGSFMFLLIIHAAVFQHRGGALGFEVGVIYAVEDHMTHGNLMLNSISTNGEGNSGSIHPIIS